MRTVVLLPGDRVIGVGFDNYRRLGKVAESHALLPKTKIAVDWDTGVREIVTKRSLSRWNPSEAPHDTDDDDEDGFDVTDHRENGSLDPNEDSSDSSSSSEEEDAQEIVDAIPDGAETVTSDSGQELDLVVINNPPNPVLPGLPGIQGHTGGRGGRGIYVQPPPPSNLHAVLQLGNWSRAPLYRQWTEVNQVADSLEANFNLYSRNVEFNWRNPVLKMGFTNLHHMSAPKTPFQYFRLLFPMQILPQIVDATSRQMEALDRGPGVTAGDIIKYFGLRLVMSLFPRMPGEGIQSYWSSNSSTKKNCDPVHADFNTLYKIPFTSFKAISDCFRLGQELLNSPYCAIDPFVDAFNERRVQAVTPGQIIVTDECMSMWKGEESVRSTSITGMHVTKIPRKPRGVGVEMKCSADGDSSVMLRLEIQKGSKVAEGYRYQTQPDDLPFHCAVVLRTVDPWLDTGRIVVADAAFSSLLTASELLRRGTWFIGIMKGYTKGFPVKYMEDFANSNPNKGDYKVVTTSIIDDQNRSRTVMGILHCVKRGKVRAILATVSNSLPGLPREIRHSLYTKQNEDGVWIKQFRTSVLSRPNAVELGSRQFGAVDLNDRFRQGILNQEDIWHTKTCWIRLFTTILGICYTDAYLAFKFESSAAPATCEEAEMRTFSSFLSELAYEMIFNTLDTVSNVSQGTRSSNSPAIGVKRKLLHQSNLGDSEWVHQWVEDKYGIEPEVKRSRLNAYRRRCSVCCMKASTYCNTCSDDEHGRFVVICGSSRNKKGNRNCWEAHVANCHDT